MDAFIENLISNLPFELNDCQFTAYVGKGTFSVVFEVFSKRWNMRRFAAKVTHIDESFISPDGRSILDPELGALMSLDHPNIIKFYDYFLYSDCLILILDYCENGTIEQFFDNSKIKNDAVLFNIFNNLLNGLVYCHEQGIAHRDLKPSNVFIDEHQRAIVADFGFASFQTHKVDTMCGTPFYCAPEIFSKKPYDPFLSDVFALGVTVYQMYTGQLPFTVEQLKEMVSRSETSSNDSFAKKEENKKEDNKKEDNKKEDNKIEDNKIEESKIEDNKKEDNKIEENKKEDNKIEDNKIEESKIEDNKIEESKIEDNKIEESKIEDNKMEKSKKEFELVIDSHGQKREKKFDTRKILSNTNDDCTIGNEDDSSMHIPFPETFDRNLKLLILKMLSKNPDDRPTMKQISESAFFKDHKQKMTLIKKTTLSSHRKFHNGSQVNLLNPNSCPLIKKPNANGGTGFNNLSIHRNKNEDRIPLAYNLRNSHVLKTSSLRSSQILRYKPTIEELKPLNYRIARSSANFSVINES
ncbi:hypothetical protein TRFO_09175 [Tritrichomonas foetus]|uniref:Protein kinase domain-containing protein n=1 Tax=Tritrichomonas foetus TaxID=1144522 RepID=A0A1J4JKA3_9EUKA|nr:hypothetical protein TRFO_09175 [Tritrichomonas foetus]|eukprot:OHS97997.1 hypothetical protein TRFO_09175 [Tritrichomonas foetus]